MKKKEAFELYNVIKGAKVSTLGDDGADHIIEACRAIRPLSSEFQESIKAAKESLKPEGFDELEVKMKEGTISDEEKIKLDRLFMSYSERINKQSETIGNEEVDLKLGKISKDDFKAFRKENKETGASQLAFLYDLMVV